MFRTGWSIIRRIKLHVQPLAPFPQSLISRAWPLVCIKLEKKQSFTLVIDTTVQNNDNGISLHFKPMRLIFMNYSV